MRHGIISDSPTLTTGFGLVSSVLSRYFEQNGGKLAFLGGHPKAIKQLILE